jgi:hypothetical protein
MRNKMGLAKLSENAMKEVKAGYTWHLSEGNNCACGCYYVNSGGSTTANNDSANWEHNLYSPIQ